MRVAMSSRYKIVVQGEASETDSDDEVYITSLPPPQTASVGLKVVLYYKPFLSHSIMCPSCHWFRCGVSSASWTLLGSRGGIWNRQWWRGGAGGPDLYTEPADTPERPATPDCSQRSTRYTVSGRGQTEPLTQNTRWERRCRNRWRSILYAFS